MVWLIAWLLMMLTAVSTVEISGTEVAVPTGPDPDVRIGGGAQGSGATIPACDPDAGTFDDTNGGAVAPGFPGIVTTDDVQPVPPTEPPVAYPEEPVVVLRCPEVVFPDGPVEEPPMGAPDGVVVSPPNDGLTPLPGAGPFLPIGPGLPDVEDGRKLTLAPIEELDLVIREIWPPQYVAQVTSGLPGGCSQFEGYTLEREGNTITVEVWNSEPAELVPCTMQYGYHPFSVELGADFESGQEYTLVVGERELSFVAQ